jgi:diguanylate cyclase (GGDEF)-like protein
MFESVLSKALQGGKEIGIILMEIDNFEEINEMHGSAKGERVLVGLAQIGLSCIRSTDYAIRYSNQQILLILNSTKESSISVIAERIRDNAEKKVGITVSIGCTSFTPVNMKDREDFINCALNALEMSRTHGGNRVTIL